MTLHSDRHLSSVPPADDSDRPPCRSRRGFVTVDQLLHDLVDTVDGGGDDAAVAAIGRRVAVALERRSNGGRP